MLSVRSSLEKLIELSQSFNSMIKDILVKYHSEPRWHNMIMLDSMMPMTITMLVLMNVSDTSLVVGVIVPMFPVMMIVVMMPVSMLHMTQSRTCRGCNHQSYKW